MGRKLGFSFSPRRALGISATKGKIARATGIPTTRQGRQRKIARTMGCSVAIIQLLIPIASIYGLVKLALYLIS